MGKYFKRFTIAVTGDFGEPKSHKAIARWTEMHGGTVATTIKDNVTHLICSLGDWKDKAPKVRQALQLGGIHIVTFDWLEDTLQKRRLQSEKRYLLSNIDKEERKRAKKEKRAAKEAAKRFEDSCRSCEDETLSSKYHIYRDETLFEYSIILARADLKTNRNERHNLKIYESHAIPHLYAVSTKYTRPGASASQVLCPLASFFHDAFRIFQEFFKKKVGHAWDDRLLNREKLLGSSLSVLSIEDHNIKRQMIMAGEEFFIYTPPKLGRPRGRMPYGWVDAEEEPEVMVEEDKQEIIVLDP